MTVEGAEMGARMLLVHTLELSQGARYPGTTLSDRIERRVAIHPRGNRTLCWFGRLLVKAGLQLQERGRAVVPQQLPLGTPAVQR